MFERIKPTHFSKFADRFFIPVAILSTLLLGFGIYYALFASPPDYQQGETVRIMYIHVPSAWMSMMVYSIMAMASASYLIWRNPLSEMIARSVAPIGAGFTLITLLTGAIWGKAMWGAWWVWDARLTSVLLLFFLYIGYISLINSFDSYERGAKSASILALVGFVNIPIIKFSVDWWNTLHQPASVIKLSGPAIHSSMMTPLMLIFFGFLCLFLSLAIMSLRTLIKERKINRLKLRKTR